MRETTSGFKDYRGMDLEIGDIVCVLYTYGRSHTSFRTAVIDSFTPKKVRFKFEGMKDLYVTYAEKCALLQRR